MRKPSLQRDCLIALLVFALLAALPIVWPSRGMSDFIIRLAAFGIFATSLNMLVGYAGLESFGHGLFFGLGAYSFALTMQKLGTSIPVAFVLTLLISVVVAVVVGWFWLTGGRYVSTDNAYVQADMVDIATDVAGLVKSIQVGDNERVTRGQILFMLDDATYRSALD